MAALVDLGRFRNGRFAEGRFSGFGGLPGAITNPVILITSRTNLQTAPDFVSFELDPASLVDFNVTPSGNGRVAHADLDVSWDFGEGVPYTYNDRVQPLGRNSRYARGYIAAHVFRTHGTHTVTVTVRQRQNGQIVTRTGTIDVTVADPEVTFAGSRTVYLDPDGIYANAPANAQTVQTLQQAFGGFFPPMGATDDPRRLLIRENVTVPVTETVQWHTRDITRMTNTHIIVENGGRSTISFTTFNVNTRNDSNEYDQNALHDMVFQGIDFVGQYDDVTQTGATPNQVFQCNASKNMNDIMVDCTIDGLNGRIVADRTAGGVGIFAAENCDFTNCNGFIWRPTNNRVVSTSGVRMRRDPLAMSERLNSDNGGPRTGNMQYEMHWGDDCFFNVGYTAFSGGALDSIQPFRLATGSLSVSPQIYMGACHLEGGFQGIIQMTQTTPDTPNAPSTAVIEQNYLLGCWQTSAALQGNRAGLIFRSNIFVLEDNASKPNQSAVVNMFIDSSQGADSVNVENEPVQVYSNTIINRALTGSGVTFVAAPDEPFNISQANNVGYAPNFDANTDQVDLAVTRGFDPFYAGYTDTTGTLDATKATPAGTAWSGVLAAGSTAIGDADTSALMAVTNWNGDLIVSATPDRGALAT